MDDAAFQMLVQMLRRGIMDESDISDMARRLDADGSHDAAHEVRSALVEASAPDRPHVVLVPRLRLGPDGGNGNT